MNEQYLAQCLINQDCLSRSQLVSLLQKKSFQAVAETVADIEMEEGNPVSKAVRKATGKELLMECDAYSSYMELFMESLLQFLEAPAVVDPTWIASSELEGIYCAVSQRMEGDACIVAGIMAEDDAFVELAERYSGEDVDSPEDELAIDSLQEFLNVVNGLYCVDTASASKEIDLGVPRWGKVESPQGNHQLLLRIYTDFGSFYVVLAADEFI